ncbi:MAG: exodeoxyribonuclease VII large subunit [Clostridium sp.]
MASVYSVTQVNAYIKNMFAQDFALNRISIKGEVSNCKYHTSGHIYFTLKDGQGAIQAVMFASKRKGLAFHMEDGQQVVVKGSIEVYERDGRYQLYAGEITQEGAGDLFHRFETLRNQLEEMGMFAPEYKSPIPKYAKTVGIVTAQTGAAIRDIMNIAERRNPYVQLILYPALVQGANAAPDIVRGIETLDRMNLDVLIVGRGGGSIEDLWAFNEECVARAIFSCKTPVISAVGHETDVTIADYVADLRAPTPSAAAELAVFDYNQFAIHLEADRQMLSRALEHRLDQANARLEQYKLRLRLYDPVRQINERRQRLQDLEAQMGRLLHQKFIDRRHRLALYSGQLHGLSPLEKISRGFGFVTNAEDRKVESVNQVEKGEKLRVRLSDGTIFTKVIKTEPAESGIL